jgi:nucleotide-binding universal stress UspA family protein
MGDAEGRAGGDDVAASHERPLLLPFDGSEGARRALARAAELFPARRAVVAFVWDSPVPEGLRALAEGERPSRLERAVEELGVVGDVLAELEVEGREAAERIAAEGVSLAEAAGLQASSRVERLEHRSLLRASGEVAAALNALADAVDAAAVVIAPQSRSVARQVALGSVSYGIVHHCLRPVVLVRS